MATFAQVDLMHEGALAGVPLPITMRPAVPLSDEEIIAFSRRNRPYRIERNAHGELEIMSPVGSDGSRWEAYVIRELGNWTGQHGGEYFSSNGGFTLPDGSMRSPDASWVSAARWAALTTKEQRGFAPLCPEFVVEIVSESDSLSQVQAKMLGWMANGAELAWMIDPYGESVSVYRSDGGMEVLAKPDWVEGEGAVAGFRLKTSQLWAV